MLKRARPFGSQARKPQTAWCTTDIDSHRCADEMLNFAESFQKLKYSVIFDEDKEEEQDSDLNSGSESETEDHKEAVKRRQATASQATTELLKNQRTRINHHF
jgi:hypothetical protein